MAERTGTALARLVRVDRQDDVLRLALERAELDQLYSVTPDLFPQLSGIYV
jgi:hypothetical protein